VVTISVVAKNEFVMKRNGPPPGEKWLPRKHAPPEYLILQV
jgi:hypothetical protein